MKFFFLASFISLSALASTDNCPVIESKVHRCFSGVLGCDWKVKVDVTQLNGYYTIKSVVQGRQMFDIPLADQEGFAEDGQPFQICKIDPATGNKEVAVMEDGKRNWQITQKPDKTFTFAAYNSETQELIQDFPCIY
jgi:streptogramin lyase